MQHPQPSQVLQTFLIGDDLFDSRLYYRVWSGADRFSTTLSKTASGFQLLEGQIANFDTLLNSFFERYWVEATDIKSVQFHVTTSGRASLTLRRVTSTCDVLELGTINVDGGSVSSTIEVSLDLPSKLQLGRLFVEVMSFADDFVIHEAAWRATEAPRTKVKIDIVICTFNNPTDTIRNVTNLLSAAQSLQDLGRIYVVDQGEKRVRGAPGFAALAGSPAFASGVRIVEQHNFGGTGGFTRGIMAALEQGGATHVLLLDDDIVIDARLLERAVSLYRYAKAPFILGGHMMDLFRPHRLAAMSEVFDYFHGGCTPIPPHDVDCSRAERLDDFLEPGLPSYNAWWLCCFPVEFIDKYGLPLPFFIRTDDTEYGTRMVEAGECVRQLPGLMVWHKPFHAKPAAWLTYYSLRNDLILCSLRRPYRKKLEERYKRYVWNCICSYQYDQALATCLALEDFARGPAEVFSGLLRRHQSILAEITALAPQSVKLSKHVFIDRRPVERFHPKLPMYTPLTPEPEKFWDR